MNLLLFILITALLVSYLSMTDLPVALAPAATCHSVSSRLLAPGIVILLVTGMFLFSGRRQMAYEDYAVISFSAIAAVLIVRFFRKDASIVFAFPGAAAGVRMVSGAGAGISWAVPAAWLAAVLVSLILSMVICRILSTVSSRSDSSLLRHLNTLGNGTTFAAVLMLLATGLNAGLLIPSIIPAETQLMVIVPIAIIAGFVLKREVESVTSRYIDRWFDVNSESVLAITISSAAVLAAYSFDGVMEHFGLGAMPLAPGLLAFSGLAGCRVAKGTAVDWTVLASKAGADMVFIPLIALLNGYIVSILVNPKDFSVTDTKVPILILLLAIVSICLVIMIVRYNSKSRTSGVTLKEQEEELYANRRAINEMEIRTMQAENENLHNLLKLKRQELIGVAMNLSEQKEFLDALHEKILSAQAETDLNRKDEILHEVHADLNLRKNFSGKIDNFYTQVELLHKDFTTRMTEKYPQLTKQERRLAILLRLEFSSKYIATLMNIAPSSVEIGRHRLRSKLGLSRNQNLTEFIKNI